MNFVDSLKMGGVDAFQLPCIKIEGAPTTETAGAVGLFCIDTATGNLYKCIAAADGVYTWKYFGGEIKSVNGVTPDENGNVVIETGGTAGGSSVDIDNTLSVEGQAADAKAVGDALYKNGFMLEYTPGVYAVIDGVATHLSVEVWQCVVLDVSKNTGATIGVVTYTDRNKPVLFVDDNFNVIESFAPDTGNPSLKYEASVTVPENATKLIIHHYSANSEGADVEVTGYIVEKYISQDAIVQERGDSEDSVMSQKAVTDILNSHDKFAYSFRRVDAVCDSYSNEAGTVTLPKNENNRYVDPVSDLYALYDGLVTAYPEYVTRTLMGTVLPDTEALPIYRYDFAPPMLLGSNTDDVCKILYCSGTHGGEVPPTLQGFRFFKDLCENWRNQELLKTLRFNCHFTVIPLVNPYGIKYDQKTNENGVNLNRNFTKGWVYVEDDGTTASPYSGESPASELATQLIEGMIANERFEFGLDHHTFANFVSSGDDRIVGYFVSNIVGRPQDASFADLVGVWISAKAVTNNTLITDLSQSYFRTIPGTTGGGYVYGAFPAGYCFESIFAWGDDEMEAIYECQKFGAEILGAIFHSAFVGYHTY